MKSISLSKIFRPIGKFFIRFHMTFFIVFIVACLVSAVLLLNKILNDAALSGDNYTSPIRPGEIDQATLDRIKELHTSNDGAQNLQLPSGRVNPFGE